MATIAVGDIHGHLEPLRDLLAVVAPEVSAGDEVVFLGDYIDRGPDSRGCIDAILDFIARVPATVTCLRGNHEDWLLKTMAEPRRHSWLLGMDGLTTVASYSAEAARVLRDAASRAGAALYAETTALPYEVFFAAIPAAHIAFLESLRRIHVSADAVCAHAGVEPGVPLAAQHPRTLIWGSRGFPDGYQGPELVVYGHHANPRIDGDGWPHPRIDTHAIGLDTIAHGVLTAVRLPDRTIWQSRRHATRQELKVAWAARAGAEG